MSGLADDAEASRQQADDELAKADHRSDEQRPERDLLSPSSGIHETDRREAYPAGSAPTQSRIRSAISSPLSSWSMWEAPVMVSITPWAPGSSLANCCPTSGRKTGSPSLNMTRAGTCQVLRRSRTRSISSAPGSPALIGTRSGKGRTAGFDSRVRQGAS